MLVWERVAHFTTEIGQGCSSLSLLSGHVLPVLASEIMLQAQQDACPVVGWHACMQYAPRLQTCLMSWGRLSSGTESDDVWAMFPWVLEIWNNHNSGLNVSGPPAVIPRPPS